VAIKFSGMTKHGGLSFIPGAALAFEDAGAEDYFVACGWAEVTDETPVYTYPEGSVEIDPDTRQNGTGLLIQDVITEMKQGDA
jgi:hypothetical protein